MLHFFASGSLMGSELGEVYMQLQEELPVRKGSIRAQRREGFRRLAVATAEETLIVDLRAESSPAQLVERRLSAVLDRGSLPLSHMRTVGLRRGGGLRETLENRHA